MARFLFVVPPLTGHVNPTISVARELELRGHEVAWVGHASRVRPLLPAGACLFPLAEDVSAEAADRTRADVEAARGLAAFKVLWESFFLPLARAMLPGVRAAVAELAPSVVVADQQTLAGGAAARLAGLPWATLSTTAAGVTEPLASALPKVHAWHVAELARFFAEAELAPLDPPDLSPSLVLVLSTEALVGRGGFPAHVRFVGPSIAARAETTSFPWDALDPSARRVLVSLGTVPSDGARRFYQVVADALGTQPGLQAIVVAPDGALPSPPPNVVVRAYVPQLALLPRVHAVVSHAGQNTVAEALAAGLPLVVAPIKYDQSVIAGQVEAQGAAVRVKFGRVGPDELRAAVSRVLTEPSFAAAAARLRASFEAAGGAAEAARCLEALAS
jgi:MGT family glycosyltransferase